MGPDEIEELEYFPANIIGFSTFTIDRLLVALFGTTLALLLGCRATFLAFSGFLWRRFVFLLFAVDITFATRSGFAVLGTMARRLLFTVLGWFALGRFRRRGRPDRILTRHHIGGMNSLRALFKLPEVIFDAPQAVTAAGGATR